MMKKIIWKLMNNKNKLGSFTAKLLKTNSYNYMQIPLQIISKPLIKLEGEELIIFKKKSGSFISNILKKKKEAPSISQNLNSIIKQPIKKISNKTMINQKIINNSLEKIPLKIYQTVPAPITNKYIIKEELLFGNSEVKLPFHNILEEVIFTIIKKEENIKEIPVHYIIKEAFKQNFLNKERPLGNSGAELPLNILEVPKIKINFGISSYQIKIISVNSEFSNAGILGKYFKINLRKNANYIQTIKKLKKKLILISSRGSYVQETLNVAPFSDIKISDSKFYNKEKVLYYNKNITKKLCQTEFTEQNIENNLIKEKQNFRSDRSGAPERSSINFKNISLINWYNLIGIKEVNSGIIGIKIEIKGRMTKMKRASRTKTNRFLKGRFSSKINKNIFITDKAIQKMIGKNGSIGIKIYLGNELQIIR